jgi:hypothetical protein
LARSRPVAVADATLRRPAIKLVIPNANCRITNAFRRMIEDIVGCEILINDDPIQPLPDSES